MTSSPPVKNRVLVTGGAGYIGSHTCKALALAGHTPIVYDNFEFGHEWAVKWGPLERGNILDRARLQAVIKEYRPDAVIHFAAYAYVGESVDQPGKYYNNNVAGSLSVLKTMRDNGISDIVFSSSCATYGIPEQSPITEATTQLPINPYGYTKLMGERMLADFGVAHGLRWVVLRYFNVAGADPDGEIGELHKPETHLIPLVLDAALGLRKDFTIFGNDHDTFDGTCIRDYVHVADIAAAHVDALHAIQSGLGPSAFNLGTGRGYSVREIIAKVEQVTKRKVPVKLGERRPGDPGTLVADASLAGSELRWAAKMSDLDSIITTAASWHRHINGVSGSQPSLNRYR